MAPTRVAVVGAGAAGMSAAYALTRQRSSSKFAVTVFERASTPGGMATSVPIPADLGADYINDGVQGCSPAFANTLRVLRVLGFKASRVGMQISFGRADDGLSDNEDGSGGTFWTNVFPSPLTRRFAHDIRKFGRVLRVIRAAEPLFAFVPVHALLRVFRFDRDFGERMVYPLVALFFGTGNQTPSVSSAILARVFNDPSMRLFEYDDASLLASVPTMLAFPKLRDLYPAWQHACTGATFRLAHTVSRVVSRGADGVVLEYVASGECGNEAEAEGGDGGMGCTGPQRAEFDELILACDADAALTILGDQASFLERRVLGNVKYLTDVTVTHTDVAYMRAHYETAFDPSLAAPDALAFARAKFRPLYYTHQYAHDRAKLEMSFDLTHYQPQFRGERPEGPVDDSSSSETAETSSATQNVLKPRPEAEADTNTEKAAEAETEAEGKVKAARTATDPITGLPEPPFDRHVFQTIFLDRAGSEQDWTIGAIAPARRIAEKTWKQQSHRWQHYAAVVPWMMWLNGRRRTYFAGAWTVLNMHEIAVVSGFAAAYRLGAEYPFKDDEECARLFRLYLGVSHGVRIGRRSFRLHFLDADEYEQRKEDRKGFFS